MGSNINLNYKKQNEFKKRAYKKNLFKRCFIYRPEDISEANDPVFLCIPAL